MNYLYNSADSLVLNGLLRDIASGFKADDAGFDASRSSSNSGSSVSKREPEMVVSVGSGEGRSHVLKLKEQKEAEMKKYGYLRGRTKLKKELAPRKYMILFSDFLKCILDFQLKNHEKFLERFVSSFRQVDLDLDGVLNPEEFHSLFLDIRFDGNKISNVSSEQQEEAEETFSTLLNIVDPSSHNRICFSAAASCLSRLGGGGGGRNKFV